MTANSALTPHPVPDAQKTHSLHRACRVACPPHLSSPDRAATPRYEVRRIGALVSSRP